MPTMFQAYVVLFKLHSSPVLLHLFYKEDTKIPWDNLICPRLNL